MAGTSKQDSKSQYLFKRKNYAAKILNCIATSAVILEIIDKSEMDF